MCICWWDNSLKLNYFTKSLCLAQYMLWVSTVLKTLRWPLDDAFGVVLRRRDFVSLTLSTSLLFKQTSNLDSLYFLFFWYEFPYLFFGWTTKEMQLLVRDMDDLMFGANEMSICKQDLINDIIHLKC
jgi:hypothetical protein